MAKRSYQTDRQIKESQLKRWRFRHSAQPKPPSFTVRNGGVEYNNA